MFKKGQVIAFSGFLLIGIGAGILFSGSEEEAASVNGESISTEAVYQELDRYFEENLQHMIDETLILQEAEVTEDEMRETIAYLRHREGVESTGELQEVLDLSERELYREAELERASEQLLLEAAGYSEEDVQDYAETFGERVIINAAAFDNRQDAEAVIEKVYGEGREFERAAHLTEEDYYLNYYWEEDSRYMGLEQEVENDLLAAERGVRENVYDHHGEYLAVEVVSFDQLTMEEHREELIESIANEEGVTLPGVLQELREAADIEIND